MRDTNNLTGMFRDLLTDEPPAVVDLPAVKARGSRMRRRAQLRVAAGSVAVAAVLGGVAVGATALVGAPATHAGPAAPPAPDASVSAATPGPPTDPNVPPITPEGLAEAGARLLAAARAHLPQGVVRVEPDTTASAVRLIHADGTTSQLSVGVGDPVPAGTAPIVPCTPGFGPQGSPPYRDCVQGSLPGGAKTAAGVRDNGPFVMTLLFIVAPDGRSRQLISNNGLPERPNSTPLTVAQLTELAKQPDMFAAIFGMVRDTRPGPIDGSAPALNPGS